MGRTIILLLMSCLAVSSCTGRKLMSELNCLERNLDNNPDSVLNVINSVDKSRLKTGKLRAKYSLLYSMALDKSLIDTTDVSIIQPAVDYYKKKGSPDEKLKAYYYLGRAQYNSRCINDAAVSFYLAEREALKATDSTAIGLLYCASANIYDYIFNYDVEYDYLNKAANIFEECKDSNHCNFMTGRLAIYYLGKEDWELADSLFRRCMEVSKNDTASMSYFITNYAKYKVLKEGPDPIGAISLLNDKQTLYQRPLSFTDYCVYAVSLALSGDYDGGEYIITTLSAEADNLSLPFWRYMIDLEKKDYRKANDDLRDSYSNDKEYIEEIMAQTVPSAIKQYLQNEDIVQKNKMKTSLLILILSTVSLLFLSMISLLLFKQRNQRQKEEFEKILSIAEQSSSLLMKSNSNLVNSIHEKEIILASLRKEFTRMFKDRFITLGELCKVYYQTKGRKDQRDVLMLKIEEIIANIGEDDKFYSRFEQDIDNDLNNIISDIKSDLNITDNKESRFLCYNIIGFEPQLIAILLNISLSNVYTKKSRLREKIKLLDTPKKEDYLSML